METTTINFPLDENEALGARPNEALVITTVQSGSAASGHLREGDKIESINGRRVKNLRDFYKVLRITHPVATFIVLRARLEQHLRPEVQQAEKPTEKLPAEIVAAIQRCPGYRYQLVRVDREEGKKFGLNIKTRDNRVIVRRIDAGSICTGRLQPLDHIMYVNGSRVSQAEVAGQLLVRGMRENGTIECVIGRPTTPEATNAAQRAVEQEDQHDPPSVRLNLDVQQIMRRQLIQAAVNREITPQGILQQPGQPPMGRVTFASQHAVLNIPSDNVGRTLHPVNPSGSQNSPIRRN